MHKRLSIVFVAIALALTWGVWIQGQSQPQQPDDFADMALPFADEMAGQEAENYNVDQLPKKATIAGARQYWKRLLSDENGDIPPNAWTNVESQVAAMRTAQRRWGIDGAGISKENWQWIGPGNIGGAITDIAFHPQYGQGGNQQVWASSAGGGIFKSDTAGKAWAPINDFLPHLSVTSLLITPNNPNIMYAGTGDWLAAISPGAGIFKSMDAGATWSQLASTNPDTVGGWRSVYELGIAPDSSYILAAHSGGISRSTDGGDSWTNTLTDGSPIMDVKIHPTNSQIAVAASYRGSSWFSTNGGQTWTAATGWPTPQPRTSPRIELAFAHQDAPDPIIVYANLNRDGGQLWKSTDGGQSYQSVHTDTKYLGGQGWVHTSIWVNPTNPNMVVVGGFNVYRSTDGGQTLTAITAYRPTKSPYPDQRIAISPPNDSNVLYLGSDGGVWRTTNINTATPSSGWEDMINNLGVTRYYGISVNPQGVVLGGTQDSGDNLFVGNPQKWSWVGFGDGGYAASDPTDSNYHYGEYIYLRIRRISNGGKSPAEDIYNAAGHRLVNGEWQAINAANPLQDAIDKKANFIAPFVLDPNDTNRLLGGAERLWRTNNAKKSVKQVVGDSIGPDWFSIKPSLNLGSSGNISAIDIATGNSDIVWVGHNNGQVYKSTNGTSNTPDWTRIGDGTLPAGRQVSRITVDPNDTSGNTVYVTFGGFSPDNLWRTTDGGTTWADVTGMAGGGGSLLGGLPNMPIYDIVVFPGNKDWLYAATEMGVFTSENGGTTWFVNNDGPANVRVTDLEWQEKTLYAGTYGRGVFKIAVGEGGPPPTCYSLDITVAPASSGQVTKSPPPNCGDKYTEGSTVTLVAAEADGSTFQNWNDNETSKTLRVTMDGNRIVTANFTSDEVCYTLTTNVAPDFGGTVEVSPTPNCSDGTRYKAGTNITLRAIPDFDFDTGRDYVFGRWTGKVQAAQNPTSLVINKDATITAGFTFAASNDAFTNADDLGDDLNFADLFGDGVRGRQLIATEVFTTITVNTSNATQDTTDPTGCEAGAGSASVWYKVTPPISGSMTIDTTGSQFDTSVVVFEGEELADLAELECDDDTEDEGEGFDDVEDFFDDEEFLDYFDDDEFFDDFYEDDFFEDDYFDEDDFFDFYEEDDFFDIEFDEASEDALAQMRVELDANKTYYIMVTDGTSPALYPQAEDEPGEFIKGIVEDDVPNGGFLTMNLLFSAQDSATNTKPVYLPVVMK